MRNLASRTEGVHLGPSVQFRSGCYQANTRTLARAEGIKRLQATRPWADIEDLRIFLEGFDAGEEYCSTGYPPQGTQEASRETAKREV